MLVTGSSYIAFIVLRYIPSIPRFIRAFLMKGCWILLKAFSAFIDGQVVFLFEEVWFLLWNWFTAMNKCHQSHGGMLIVCSVLASLTVL
jgi:hypothetical protein